MTTIDGNAYAARLNAILQSERPRILDKLRTEREFPDDVRLDLDDPARPALVFAFGLREIRVPLDVLPQGRQH